MNDNNGSDRRRSINRRRYLKATGALGLGVGGVERVAAGGDTTEVVVARTRAGPAETRRVPTKWYEHTRRARDRLDDVRGRFGRRQGVASVGLGTGEGTIGGLKEKKIEVHLDGSRVPANLPDQAGGIPVDVANGSSGRYLCYTGSYDPLRGGISIENGEGTEATACCRVWDGGEPCLLTVRHLFTDGPEPCDSIPDAYAYRHGDRIGVFKDNIKKHDAFWVSLFSGYSVSDDIVAETATVEGWVTQSGLDTFSSDGTTLRKRGIDTCKETYTIRSYGNTLNTSCNPNHQDVVFYEGGDANPGDSGSPVYYVADGGGAFLSSILSAIHYVDCGFFCTKEVYAGSAAHAIQDESGIDFD